MKLAWTNKLPRGNGRKENSGFSKLIVLPGEKAFSHDHLNGISVAFPYNWGFEAPTNHSSMSMISEVMSQKPLHFT